MDVMGPVGLVLSSPRPHAHELLEHPFLEKRDDRKVMKKTLSMIFLQKEFKSVGF